MPPSADSYHPRVSLHDGHVLGQLVDGRGNGASLCPRFQCLSQHQLGLLGHGNDGRTLFIERQGRIGVPPRIGSLTEPGCIDMLACASGIGNRRDAPRRAACAPGPRLDTAVCDRVVLLRRHVECDVFLEIHRLCTRSCVMSYRHDFGPVLELHCIGDGVVIVHLHLRIGNRLGMQRGPKAASAPACVAATSTSGRSPCLLDQIAAQAYAYRVASMR